MELVDTPALGAGGPYALGGSSPLARIVGRAAKSRARGFERHRVPRLTRLASGLEDSRFVACCQMAALSRRGAVQPVLMPVMRLRYCSTMARWTGERRKRMRSASLRQIETEPERSPSGWLHSHSPIAPSSRGQERRSPRAVRQAPGTCRGWWMRKSVTLTYTAWCGSAVADPGRQHAYQRRQPSTARRATGPEVVSAFPPVECVSMRLAGPSLPSLEARLGVLYSGHYSLGVASGCGHDS